MSTNQPAVAASRAMGASPTSWVRSATDVSGPDKLSKRGAGGIRPLDRALQPYNGLANRRLQPLGHVSVHAENGALWMRSHMLAEVCPSPGAMARPRHAAESLLAARPR